MSPLFWIIFGFLLAMISSEVALQGTKLQTGLVRVVTVHCVIALAVYTYLKVSGQISTVAFFIFWAGAFLSWFGVRSHAESSILLRMLFLLKHHPMTEEELLEEYESHYGAALRVEELVRGGLIDRGSQGIVLTKKGKSIARIVSLLK